MDFLKSAFTKSSKAINLVARPISQTISSSIIKPVQQAILQHQNVQQINKCISLLRDTSNRPQFKKHAFFSINFKQQIHSKNIKLTQFIAQQLYQAKKSLKRYDKKSSIDEPLALIHNQLSQKTGIFDYVIAIWVDYFISQATKLKNVLQFKKTAQSSGCTIGNTQFQDFQCVNIVIKRLLHRQLTILIQFLIIVIQQQFQDHFQFFLRNRKEKVKKQQLLENLKKGVTANSNFSKIKYFFLKNVQESQTRFNASEIKQNLKDIQKVFPIQKIPNSFQQTFSLLDSFYLEHNIQLLVRYLRQIDKKIFRDIMQYRQFYNLPKLKRVRRLINVPNNGPFNGKFTQKLLRSLPVSHNNNLCRKINNRLGFRLRFHSLKELEELHFLYANKHAPRQISVKHWIGWVNH